MLLNLNSSNLLLDHHQKHVVWGGGSFLEVTQASDPCVTRGSSVQIKAYPSIYPLLNPSTAGYYTYPIAFFSNGIDLETHTKKKKKKATSCATFPLNGRLIFNPSSDCLMDPCFWQVVCHKRVQGHRCSHRTFLGLFFVPLPCLPRHPGVILLF